MHGGRIQPDDRTGSEEIERAVNRLDTSSKDEALLSTCLPSCVHGGSVTNLPYLQDYTQGKISCPIDLRKWAQILIQHLHQLTKGLPQVCLTSSSPTDGPPSPESTTSPDYEDYEYDLFGRPASCCR